MRLYSGKIPLIADEIVRTLVKEEMIETSAAEEVVLDMVAVLKEFSRRDRQVLDEAKRRMELQGLSYSMLGKIKQRVAKEMSFPVPEEALPYLVDQLLNMLFHSSQVEEVFADDAVIRKALVPILNAHTNVESELDREVRSKIKNLAEGTASFEIEYQRVMEQMKSKKGLS
ncbi:MAG: DUF507 family protein [Sandaracinaceae bacterium]|jgi:hypothetical protein|nr:DUF507 family protein [Sandaracinaceae bacterium]MBK6811728.1 DUF507 family protein [Sandaracinaceae bacterium]MBK7155727.1 DUF507 family protein [Sandaracinaceae bacterium]MBK7775378.1 DUF507 family protein [Sandaracinaceae bacterium]MBK8408157.1 DUF507 family protein [Sandaracinaceae bacterium]